MQNRLTPNNPRCSIPDLEFAMRTLVDEREFAILEDGPPSKRCTRIARA